MIFYRRHKQNSLETLYVEVWRPRSFFLHYLYDTTISRISVHSHAISNGCALEAVILEIAKFIFPSPWRRRERHMSSGSTAGVLPGEKAGIGSSHGVQTNPILRRVAGGAAPIDRYCCSRRS
jgi:hypothetical protein